MEHIHQFLCDVSLSLCLWQILALVRVFVHPWGSGGIRFRYCHYSWMEFLGQTGARGGIPSPDIALLMPADPVMCSCSLCHPSPHIAVLRVLLGAPVGRDGPPGALSTSTHEHFWSVLSRQSCLRFFCLGQLNRHLGKRNLKPDFAMKCDCLCSV